MRQSELDVFSEPDRTDCFSRSHTAPVWLRSEGVSRNALCKTSASPTNPKPSTLSKSAKRTADLIIPTDATLRTKRRAGLMQADFT